MQSRQENVLSPISGVHIAKVHHAHGSALSKMSNNIYVKWFVKRNMAIFQALLAVGSGSDASFMDD